MVEKQPESVTMRRRIGEDELEVTGQAAYVEEKIAEFVAQHAQAQSGTGGAKGKPKRVKHMQADAAGREQDKVDVPGIVDHIHEVENFEVIEREAINKRSALPRVLMCFYFAKKIENPYLSTKNVEQITDQMDIKILSENVSRAIRKNSKYFSADRVRRHGVLVRYKLNRQGIAAFEKIVQSEKS